MSLSAAELRLRASVYRVVRTSCVAFADDSLTMIMLSARRCPRRSTDWEWMVLADARPPDPPRLATDLAASPCPRPRIVRGVVLTCPRSVLVVSRGLGSPGRARRVEITALPSLVSEAVPGSGARVVAWLALRPGCDRP